MRGYLFFLTIFLFVSVSISQPSYQVAGSTDETSLLDVEDTVAGGYFDYGLTVNTMDNNGIDDIEGLISTLYGVSSYGIALDGEAGLSSYGGENIGLYGNAYGGDYSWNAGIVTYASGGTSSDNYSAYFGGDVVVEGSCDPCSPSDIMFKKNIHDLDGGLEKVMALKPKIYEMRTDEFKNTMNLANGNQFGLIAQDVESVLPELVHQISAPPRLTKAEKLKGVKKPFLKYKALSYMGLIPVMLKAIQEQQGEIDSLKAALQSR